MAQVSALIGQSPAFLAILEQASRAAPLERPVLVVGERGTGKELIAERLHRLSPRWDRALVALNCAALPESLLDSELFGYEAGAFTGAVKARAGRFEEAHGATLFLDEIGCLAPAAQERLLRILEYGELWRLGAARATQVDVRVIAATNEDLPSLAATDRFRADLLDRLSFEVLTLPPLRARPDDVPLLTDHFGRRMAAELGWSSYPGFTASALRRLMAHCWPGNVRELRNTVERAVYRWDEADGPIDELVFDPFASPWRPSGPLSRGEQRRADEPPAPDRAVEMSSLDEARARAQDRERELIAAALARHRHNRRRTAAELGLSYDQLRHAMRRLGLG